MIGDDLQINRESVLHCQVIYSQFGLAIHQNDHQARRRFVEWAQNEIAVFPDFHKRILFSDEAHFWLNGYVNKQNCRIWSEANPQVYVETPLHPEKLTVWCALWAGGIIEKCEECEKGPLTPAGLLKLVKRFEETGKMEDRARAGRPCLKEARAPCIAVEMEAIASEAASGTSSAREAARRLGLPQSSVRNILHRILQL
ncbi:hypothetical protein TNCV_4652541 [Trichonephila clavipes]|nr:hypothetical protein TNCV_4652541 [Trichonephila clavipes]